MTDRILRKLAGAFVLTAIGLVVAACGASSSGQNPINAGTNTAGTAPTTNPA